MKAAYIKWTPEYIVRVSGEKLLELRDVAAANVSIYSRTGSQRAWLWSERLERVQHEIEERKETK